MSTSTYVLRDDSLERRGELTALRVGLPWYRSIPWAGVAGVRVALDGRDVEVLTLDGQPLAALAQRDDYWFIQHRAEVTVAGTVPEGSALVEVQLDLRIPGPTKPDGSPMEFSFRLEREITAA